MKLNFLRDCKIIRVEGPAVAATSTLTSDVVDMQGYDSVAFIADLGDVTSGSVLLLTAKGNTANSVSSPTPLAYPETAGGTAGASDYDDKLLAIDIQKPRERYVFCTLARGTQNAVVNGIYAILYNAHEMPLDDTAVAALYKAYNEANDPAGT